MSVKPDLDPVIINYGRLVNKYCDNVCDCKKTIELYLIIGQQRTDEDEDEDETEWDYNYFSICCDKQLDSIIEFYTSTPHILDLTKFKIKPSPIDLTKFFNAQWYKIIDPKNIIEKYKTKKYIDDSDESDD